MAEVDGPDAIINFLEAEHLLLERVCDKEQTLLEADRPGVRDALGNVVARVLDGRDGPCVWTGRRLVERGGRSAAEELVRALVVVEDAESVEGALLGGQVTVGWPRGRRLEGPMHPRVGTVLLGAGGQDPLVLNAQPDPPHVELRQPVNAAGGKRHAVVRANGARQPVLAEEAVEDRADALALGREQAVTAEQVARVLVGDRERIAIEAIAGAEVALEIRRQRSFGRAVVGGTTPGWV
jgi:hypothetical protein